MGKMPEYFEYKVGEKYKLRRRGGADEYVCEVVCAPHTGECLLSDAIVASKTGMASDPYGNAFRVAGVVSPYDGLEVDDKLLVRIGSEFKRRYYAGAGNFFRFGATSWSDDRPSTCTLAGKEWERVDG